VLVVTDLNSSIGVRVERTRARANVRGTGKPDLCRLDYALRSEDIIEGDPLVTSGTDGVFPRGLAVGRVTRLERKQHGLFQDAKVVPAVDVTRVEEVLVLTAWERATEVKPAAFAPTPEKP
jgi:rod shape-determining protein MreC